MKAFLVAVALVLSAGAGTFAEDARAQPSILPRIILKSPDEVHAALGKPDSPCEKGKYGLKCVYQRGQVEIVFIKGRADWITYHNPPNVGFYPAALLHLGVNCPTDVGKFTVGGDAIRWSGTCAGLSSAQLFPGEGTAPVEGDFRRLGYVYIKAATP